MRYQLFHTLFTHPKSVSRKSFYGFLRFRLLFKSGWTAEEFVNTFEIQKKEKT